MESDTIRLLIEYMDLTLHQFCVNSIVTGYAKRSFSGHRTTFTRVPWANITIANHILIPFHPDISDKSCNTSRVSDTILNFMVYKMQTGLANSDSWIWHKVAHYVHICRWVSKFINSIILSGRFLSISYL